MTEGSSFTADIDGIASGTDIIKELGEFAASIGASFRAGVADTSWTGNDSYGHQLKAKFTENTSAAQQTFDAISEGVSAIGDGTLSNLNETLKTQTGVLDSIGQESAATSGTPGGKS
ncbi:MAG: hypothetical protein QOF98_3248 [Streptomyces sp.]|jgi:hypothetical protein|nr:hypothetical protein [Streptomyces sp.]